MLKPIDIPKELISDIIEGKNIQTKYYIAKIVRWENKDKWPKCLIQKSIGEAGNLEIESLRLLKTHDICSENYEKEDGSINKHLKVCL